ncbi:MAG: efflux RND transporter periplasmic adaptor subunit, partial [Bdellovibrionales bacterium]|nr:efflux RND transporter periplasmic adaptor subunit [Bdellovibrionales bacterium]
QSTVELGRLQQLLKTRSVAAAEIERKKGELSSGDNEIESTQAELRAAQSNVSVIETQIAEATLKSTIKGTVTSTWVPLDQFVEGSPVKLGDPLVMVSGEGSLTLKSTVREQDVLKIAQGMPVDVSLPAIPGRRWMGRLVSVDDAATIDQSTGAANFRVQVRFDVKDIPIKSGMDANAMIIVGLRKNVLMIPRSALSLKGGNATVQVKQGRKFKETPVRLGLIGDTHVEIVEGLQENEPVAAIYDDLKAL